MGKIKSFEYYSQESDSSHSWNDDFGFSNASDRRYALSWQTLFQQPQRYPMTPKTLNFSNGSMKPFPSTNASSIDMNAGFCSFDQVKEGLLEAKDKLWVLDLVLRVFRVMRTGNRQMKRLLIMISLNVAYSTAELVIGLFTGRIGLVSDAFHLTFGSGLLTFSLFAMAASRRKPDHIYTYGYFYCLCHFPKLLNHSMLLSKMNQSKTVINLLVNLIGVWFFSNYAQITLVYRKPEDMNCHSVCLLVLADSIRSAGLILASWFLSLGVNNAEVLCLGLVSGAVFMLVMPLFKATGCVLLQMSPPNIPSSALTKCWRQITSREDVIEVSQIRLWELVPGHLVVSLSLEVKKEMDDRSILEYIA